MNLNTLKQNPVTYALGKTVMNIIRLARTVQHIIERQRIPAMVYVHKREFLLSLAKAYQLDTFIETGTFLGETVAYMQPHFKRIISYELAPDLHKANVKKFAKAKHIELYLGDSGKLMPQHLKTLKKPAFFWLDGHFSGGPTAHGDLASPVVAELTHIFNHPIKNHVIVIDDARDFRGLDSYPTIGQMQALVDKYPHYMLRINNDMLVIAPAA